jgi:hypothetical protein
MGEGTDTVDDPFFHFRSLDLQCFGHLCVRKILADVLEAERCERQKTYFALELYSIQF